MLLPSVMTINALVVGATQGIGLAFTQQLLLDNRVKHLFATYRSKQTAESLLTLASQHPNRLHLIKLDIVDEEQIESGLAAVKLIAPNLHVAINCVGLLHNQQQQPEKALRQLNSKNLLTYFQINSIGPVLLAKHLLGLFKHAELSIFATISAKIGSIGDNRIGGWYGYRASKAALNMFLKTSAIEYSRRSPKTILVMLHPGTTDTGLSKPFQRGVAPEKLFSTERTVTQLLSVLENVTIKDSGAFFSWDGSRLPW
ncbi:oxidoreductase, short chain dehydrogenase/reductase family [Synechococcus sp. PCC 7335]|uniref:SDR family NAD(P)-dependent oxidoreductase n=1 Tax=Synechococcus sp. (strain ATCC 29403 / PCC 7335) TaxID=91464 RepID=UPI00017EE028|nr:SDR family NAD(P)-dependent oxidoreductase [Synechococcus sp. PCC 7335]EDX86042.1 oxidoreductase, short chain dehydrogenase/reductase family [Synechococcus sp. PCC 7335]